MKTLYESILSSTNSGKSEFTIKNIDGCIESTNLKDIINISKAKRVIEEDITIPFSIKYSNDSRVLAILLTRFDYTKQEIDLFKKDGIEISSMLKSKLADFLHKKNKDKFEFRTTYSNSTKTGTLHIVNAEGEDIIWKTLFHYIF